MNWLLSVVTWLAVGGMVESDGDRRVSLLVVGDINLGRHVGQMILKDSLQYPFVFAGGVFSRYDFVFGNLESQITDQKGETQHPRDRYIFCAPPKAALSLKMAGISAVATANNHAYDYKMVGLRETIGYLRDAGVMWIGTSADSGGTFSPIILDKKGIRVGFLAYTQFVNRKTGWKGHVSLFDRVRMKEDVAILRPKVDLVMVSYHGGDEYKDRPNKHTLREMRDIVDAGADFVFGHHPHVPQGAEKYKGKWIFYSLGNFVFYQPQREWTQRGIAVALNAVKDTAGVRIESIDLLPLTAGFQPSFAVPASDRLLVEERLRKLSSVSIIRKDTTFAVIQ